MGTYEKDFSKKIAKQIDEKITEFKKNLSENKPEPPINSIANKVYSMIERRIEIEKERRGFV